MTPHNLRNCPVSLCLCSCLWRDVCVCLYTTSSDGLLAVGVWQMLLGCSDVNRSLRINRVMQTAFAPGGRPNGAVLSANYVPYFPRCPSEPDAALWAAERVDYVEQSLQIGSERRGDRSRPLGSLITRDSLSPALSLPLIPLSLL